jgi:hypothetical protein
VARIETDDPSQMRLETGVIPGGRYARRKIMNSQEIIRDGELPMATQEFTQAHDIDPNRFALEYYWSRTELQLFVPVRG